MRRLTLLLVFLLCFPLRAFGYNEAIHAFITSRALAQEPHVEDVLQPPTQADLDAFRKLFWAAATQKSAGFAQQFPTFEQFGAPQFKQLCMLDPAATVHGFDLTADDEKPLRELELLTAASRWPDDDQRNRHRFLREPQTQAIVRDRFGDPVPYDPATLDFGSLSGTTSQGHAHYGLVTGPLSDDPEVLKKDPRRFAVPPTAHAWGAELAQLYTDLALLAEKSDLPSRRWIADTFAGAAFHHIEDVANQIHTVQVGIYDFFEAAFLQSKLREVKTLGGLLGERRTLKQIGLRLIANHHLLSEDLFAKRVSEGVAQAVPDVARDDAAFAKAAQAAIDRSGGAFGAAIAQAMIDTSSLEAPEVYRLAWKITKPTLHDGLGHEYDGARDDPDQYVKNDAGTQAALLSFYELEGRGLRRAATALRLWEAQLGKASSGSDAVMRSLALLLPYHEAAAARRASYEPQRAQHEGIAWGYPVAALLLLAAAALLARRLLRRSGSSAHR